MLFIPFLPCRKGSGFISETIVSPLNCETKTNFWSNQQKHFLHGRRVFIHLSKLHGRSYVSGLMEEESTKNFSASCFYPNPPAQRSPTEWVKKITSLQHALSTLRKGQLREVAQTIRYIYIYTGHTGRFPASSNQCCLH